MTTRPIQALSVLGVLDVGRQVVREVADAVDQRVPEGHNQPGKRADGQQRHHRHCDATPANPPLQSHHKRIQQQRNEPGDDQQQDHAALPVDDLPAEVDQHDHGNRHEYRAQRHIPALRLRATSGTGGSAAAAILELTGPACQPGAGSRS